MEKRTDSHTALLIDTILNAADVHGIYLSTFSLHRAGIPFDVAVRLSRSREDRRKYWQLVTATFDFPRQDNSRDEQRAYVRALIDTSVQAETERRE